MKLTRKKELFANEYMIDLNATQAAIRAGYSVKTAKSQGQRLLTNVDLKNRIDQLTEEKKLRSTITADMVLAEFGKIAFSDLRKCYDENGSLRNPTELDDATAAALSSIEIQDEFYFKNGQKIITGTVKKVKMHSKLQALESLARHLGMFNDKLKIDFDLMSNDELDRIFFMLIQRHEKQS